MKFIKWLYANILYLETKKYNILARLLTKKCKQIPILFILFDLDHYLKHGSANSCTMKIHPNLKDDKLIVEVINELVDYIRMKYDMNNML